MIRSATGAVDPDTCKQIGNSRLKQVNIWMYKKVHTKKGYSPAQYCIPN